MKIKTIDLEYMKECFKIDFDTGLIEWKERPLHHFKSEKDSKSWHTGFHKRSPGFACQIKKYTKSQILKNKDRLCCLSCPQINICSLSRRQ